MSWRKLEEQLKEAVNKNDTVAVEQIIQANVALWDDFKLHPMWLRLCKDALKNRCLPMVKSLMSPECIASNFVVALINRCLSLVKLLLPAGSIANNFVDDATSLGLMDTAVHADFLEGVKFLHSKGIPLDFTSENLRSNWNALVHCVRSNKVEVLKYLLELKDLDKNPDKEETLLMLCCHQLNIKSLDILLKSELINTINQQTHDLQYSALHYCVGGRKHVGDRYSHNRNLRNVPLCVQLLVESGADVNLRDSHGRTPIQLAVECGMVTTAIYLVQRGANYLDHDKYQNNLLHCLAGSRIWEDSYDELVQLLITHGIDINKRNSLNKTPLYLAVSYGNEEMAKTLIKSHCDVNITPVLLESIGRKQTTIAKILIKAGCDVNITYENDVTTMSVTIQDATMAQILIKAGCDVNSTDKDGVTPLLESIIRRMTTIAEMLIKAGCDVNTTDKNGVTPLMKCVEMNNLVLVKQLIDHGASVNAKDNKGCFVLDYLFRSHQYTIDQPTSADIVKMMIEAGADIHKCNNLLYRAISGGHYKTASLLLEHGIDVNTVDENGDKPLALVSAKGKLELVTLLTSTDCDINHQNLKGETALHKAIKVSRYSANYEDKEKIINTLLIQNGINVNISDVNGQTALSIAVANGDTSVTDQLLKAGADVNHCDKRGETPLLMAVKNQDNVMVDVLLKAGADVNHCVKRRQSPLLAAVRTCNLSILECLLNAEADVNLSDNTGKTALMIAASNCIRPILECLLNTGADVNKTDTDGRSAIHAIMVGGRRGRKWINCLKLLLINKCHVSLDTPGEDGNTLFQWLLKQNEVDLIWYLVTENCSLRSLDLRMVKDKLRFPDTLMLFKILFESGAPKNVILSRSTYDVVLSGSKGTRKKQRVEFRAFCKSRSLKSRCRRKIRNCIGPGISSKITQVGLPQPLQDYVVMKDMIPEKYFTLVLNDKDDAPRSGK
ncbi:serine/threonine-protein phosphatase 6 regulatory ankyrin repeat subunit A-like [Patella vulgata]|uniref:serine/threonine-protein phosphatase 6 regulatory ankyrin repeat subunit A-like n=1 Tax=Patella vulgata TaxID=6465 RepID=UPI0024A920A2|nr:serine/threonine-protein phosphatase 6 regulatory ankyrin repeat subunit A-like [Patella vulgata]